MKVLGVVLLLTATLAIEVVEKVVEDDMTTTTSSSTSTSSSSTNNANWTVSPDVMQRITVPIVPPEKSKGLAKSFSPSPQLPLLVGAADVDGRVNMHKLRAIVHQMSKETQSELAGDFKRPFPSAGDYDPEAILRLLKQQQATGGAKAELDPQIVQQYVKMLKQAKENKPIKFDEDRGGSGEDGGLAGVTGRGAGLGQTGGGGAGGLSLLGALGGRGTSGLGGRGSGGYGTTGEGDLGGLGGLGSFGTTGEGGGRGSGGYGTTSGGGLGGLGGLGSGGLGTSDGGLGGLGGLGGRGISDLGGLGGLGGYGTTGSGGLGGLGGLGGRGSGEGGFRGSGGFGTTGEGGFGGLGGRGSGGLGASEGGYSGLGGRGSGEGGGLGLGGRGGAGLGVGGGGLGESSGNRQHLQHDHPYPYHYAGYDDPVPYRIPSPAYTESSGHSITEHHVRGSSVGHKEGGGKMGLLKKVLNMLAAFIPLGLFLAVIPPSIISINSTSSGLPNRQRSVDGEATNPLLALVEKYGLHSLDDPECESLFFCEMARLGGQPDGNIVQNAFWRLAHESSDKVADTLGLKEVFKAIRTDSCSIYKCRESDESDEEEDDEDADAVEIKELQEDSTQRKEDVKKDKYNKLKESKGAKKEEKSEQ